MLLIATATIVAALTRYQPQVVTFVVPEGTAARIAAGEAVNVVPATIVLRAGDRLVIRNDDREPVRLGAFRIEAGQRLSHEYRAAGVYDLECSVHPAGKLQIVVYDPPGLRLPLP
jgi:hypothetical protein